MKWITIVSDENNFDEQKVEEIFEVVSNLPEPVKTTIYSSSYVGIEQSITDLINKFPYTVSLRVRATDELGSIDVTNVARLTFILEDIDDDEIQKIEDVYPDSNYIILVTSLNKNSISDKYLNSKFVSKLFLRNYRDFAFDDELDDSKIVSDEEYQNIINSYDNLKPDTGIIVSFFKQQVYNDSFSEDISIYDFDNRLATDLNIL